MKPIEESADEHGDFAGDESTSVMGADLLSSLTERSRRIEVVAATIPEPDISFDDDGAEPVTAMSPTAPPKLLVADREFPVLGDEDSTVMMEDPEPTTVAVRSRCADAPSPPEAPPALAAQPLPAPSLPDPPWVAALPPRGTPTIRVAPLAAPTSKPTPEGTFESAAGSRRLSAVAALALGVAAWTLGLGHHELLPMSAVSSPSSSVTSVFVVPSSLRSRVETAAENVRTAFVSLVGASASVASARNESTAPERSKHRPTAHRQRS